MNACVSKIITTSLAKVLLKCDACGGNRSAPRLGQFFPDFQLGLTVWSGQADADDVICICCLLCEARYDAVCFI